MNLSDPKSAALIKAGLIRGVDVVFAASVILSSFALGVLFIAGHGSLALFAGFSVFIILSLAIWAILLAYRVLSNVLQLYGGVITALEDSRRREAAAGIVPPPNREV